MDTLCNDNTYATIKYLNLKYCSDFQTDNIVVLHSHLQKNIKSRSREIKVKPNFVSIFNLVPNSLYKIYLNTPRKGKPLRQNQVTTRLLTQTGAINLILYTLTLTIQFTRSKLL